MRKIILFFICLVLVLFAFGCVTEELIVDDAPEDKVTEPVEEVPTPPERPKIVEPVPKEKPTESDTPLTECVTDSDCVPASCCHADSCVLRDQAPDCYGMLCTMECAPDTMDCGGGCLCQNGVCNAELSTLSEPLY